jgi:GNAT superfamily N-acetyltransferase
MAPRTSEAGLAHPAYRGVTLRAADAAAALPLSIEANWNQTEADWQFMLGAAHAFGFEDAAGTLVASTLVIPYGPALAWIGMVLVSAPARRNRLATVMMHRAVAWCRDRALVPQLDATSAGREVYRSLGFRDLRAVTRWRRSDPEANPFATRRAVAPNLSAAQPAQAVAPGELGLAEQLDRQVFGADRSELLRWLHRSRPDLAFGLPGRGFALGRNGRIATQMGPLVAATEREAITLLQASLERIAGPVIVDVPAGRTKFEHELAVYGLTPFRELIRMGWGPDGEFGQPDAVFALAGFELG